MRGARSGPSVSCRPALERDGAHRRSQGDLPQSPAASCRCGRTTAPASPAAACRNACSSQSTRGSPGGRRVGRDCHPACSAHGGRAARRRRSRSTSPSGCPRSTWWAAFASRAWTSPRRRRCRLTPAKPDDRRYWDAAHHDAELAKAHQAVFVDSDGMVIDGSTSCVWIASAVCSSRLRRRPPSPAFRARSSSRGRTRGPRHPHRADSPGNDSKVPTRRSSPTRSAEPLPCVAEQVSCSRW